MGFLDHSTNNIIIDAVLTNIGREMLASNAGVFLINKFSLSDDEVDYSLITKFGRTVGKEKIIKNTPIFEAQTSADMAQKYRCQSIQDPSVKYLPVVQIENVTGLESNAITGGGTAGVVTAFDLIWNGGSTASVSIKQKMLQADQSKPDGLVDLYYDVYVNNLFVEVALSSAQATQMGQYNSLDPLSNIARYALQSNGGDMQITVKAKQISGSTFSQFSDPGISPEQITTIMSVVGRNSGSRTDCKIVLLTHS